MVSRAAARAVTALVAGMVAGADSIEDMGLLRHGAMGKLFSRVRAPSTLGTFLRALRWSHVRQLGAVASRFLAALVTLAPVLRDAAQVSTSTSTSTTPSGKRTGMPSSVPGSAKPGSSPRP